jgi:hypothetical protein
MDNLSDYETKKIIEQWKENKLYDIIINPITNRKIKKNGSIYKKIDKKYEQLINNKFKNIKIENNDEYNILKKEGETFFTYESLNLDINIKYIINKIKIVNINNLSIILNYNNNFSSTKFNFDVDQEKYNYDIIKINKLIVGIKGTEIEDVFPKNNATKYISFIQYPNYINIINKTLNDIKNIFCLLCVEKQNIEKHDEQEIALYLLTLQYWNYLLENYKKYGWIDNLLAIVKVNNECYIYNIKIEKKYMEKFINKCKSFKYDFEEIVIEKCKLDINKQLELIKYLGFGIFDVFNKI